MEPPAEPRPAVAADTWRWMLVVAAFLAVLTALSTGQLLYAVVKSGVLSRLGDASPAAPLPPTPARGSYPPEILVLDGDNIYDGKTTPPEIQLDGNLANHAENIRTIARLVRLNGLEREPQTNMARQDALRTLRRESAILARENARADELLKRGPRPRPGYDMPAFKPLDAIAPPAASPGEAVDWTLACARANLAHDLAFLLESNMASAPDPEAIAKARADAAFWRGRLAAAAARPRATS